MIHRIARWTALLSAQAAARRDHLAHERAARRALPGASGQLTAQSALIRLVSADTPAPIRAKPIAHTADCPDHSKENPPPTGSPPKLRRTKARARQLLCAAAIMVGAMAAPAAANAASYGFAVPSNSDFANRISKDCWFQALTANGDTSNQATISSQEYPVCPAQSNGSHLFSYARYFVPWDALETSNSDSHSNPNCVNSQANLDGASAWNNLLAALRAGNADGLEPLVVLTAGTKDHAPEIPTDNDYYCGLYSLMSATSYSGLHVPNWEVFNEPDNYAFPGPNKFNHTSPAEEAADFYEDAWYARNSAGADKVDANDGLIAGSFNYGSVGPGCCSYIDAYLAELQTIASGFGNPTAIAGHPYNDVTQAHANGSNFYDTMNLRRGMKSYGFGNTTPIWGTESGDWLDGPVDGTTDGNPSYQAPAATAFLYLPNPNNYLNVQRVYWYGYVPSNNFDSMLADVTGNGRESYCVLFGQPATNCQGDPTDNATDPAG